jgi:predicted porin
MTSRNFRRTALGAAAIATLMAAGTAAAQVSLGGRMDQSIVVTSPGKTELTHGSANRLIFRAEDDLGGGYKAYTYLQHRFLGDSGLPRSGPFWYYSYVGLKGAFGDIRLGNQKSPIDDATGSDFEVWDGDTVASSFSRIAGGQKIWTNGVNYTSPAFAGFRINAGMAFHEEVPKVVRGQGISVLYDNGGLSMAVSSQRSPTNVRTDGVGASYTAERFRVLGTWAHSERVGGTKEQTDWHVSAGYKITDPGEARVLYNSSELAGVKTRLFGLGYFHFLSKRTAVYAAASQTRTDGLTAVKASQVGIRHSF